MGDENVMNIWKNCRYRNIINQILPYKFKNIIIEHYDSFNKNEKEIKQILVEQDNNSLTIFGEFGSEIKTKQTFISRNFVFSTLENNDKHYILLDFAHVMYYYYYKSVPEYYMCDSIKKERIKYKLNCIYINYPNDPDMTNIYWENIKYFEYDRDSKKITSYIELFLKALSDNEIYLTQTLNIPSANLYNSNLIRFEQIYYNILDKIFIEKQIIPNIKKINNGKLPLNFDDKININKNKLYKDFFNNLFLSITHKFNITIYNKYL
jgi:hypothetical protein